MAANPADLSALISLLKESTPELAGAAGGEATSSGPVQPQKPAQTGSVLRRLGEASATSLSAVAAGGSASGFDAQSIWSPEEVVTVHEALAAPSATDARRRPEFDYAYKQKVGSEDVFLGLSGTTESSIHCDTLVMRVLLPGERFADIDLDCTEDRIVVSAAQQCVELARRGIHLCAAARAACSLPRAQSPAPVCAQQAGHLPAQQGLVQECRRQVGRCKERPRHHLSPRQVGQLDGRPVNYFSTTAGRVRRAAVCVKRYPPHSSFKIDIISPFPPPARSRAHSAL